MAVTTVSTRTRTRRPAVDTRCRLCVGVGASSGVLFVGWAVQEIKRKVTNIEEIEENNANGYAVFVISFISNKSTPGMLSFKNRSR